MLRCLVPDEYYSHLDMSGKRVDLYERPELCKGQVEFEAGREYCVRPPMFPTYLFLLGSDGGRVRGRRVVPGGGVGDAGDRVRGDPSQSGRSDRDVRQLDHHGGLHDLRQRRPLLPNRCNPSFFRGIGLISRKARPFAS